nr:hypothetical protein [Tanacetum cinerariifolium]
MFEQTDVEASVWRDQKGRYGLAKRYPLTHFTLEQLLNNVRIEGKEVSEMSLELLRLVRRQLNEGPRRRDAAYLQTQLLIAQKEEAGIQLQAEEYDLTAAAADLDEIEEVNANCILMANLQQVSTSSTQTDNALVYDSDRSTE